MKVHAIIDEHYSDYKKPSMMIGVAYCGGKCCTEAGLPLSHCHNDEWRHRDPKNVNDDEICVGYMNNPITQAIVFGGLEPLEQQDEVLSLVSMFRNKYGCDDDIVIYTGYTEIEASKFVKKISEFKNIIIKFGRYVPSQTQHYDETLGVYLASDNQYAKVVS